MLFDERCYDPIVTRELTESRLTMALCPQFGHLAQAGFEDSASMNAAKKLLSPYHAELTIENVQQCTIDFIFSKMKHIFVADNAVKGSTKFEIGSLKEEYKKKMKEAKKKAKAEKERLEAQRQKLLAQQEEERRLIEEASLVIDYIYILALRK